MASNPDDSGMGDPGMQRLRSLMSTVAAEDFERFDPPADLWDRISASIASARTPDLVVEYWIDADDVVFASGDGWAEFARNNDGSELVDLAPGRTLWSHFDTDEVRDLWRAVVARVRSQQAVAKVPLRCDAPGMRRWFEMTITPGDNDKVHFSSALVVEEQRPTVSLLETHTERLSTAPAVPVCGWCGQAHDGSSWMTVEDLVRSRRLLEQTAVPPIVYGICPSCRDAMSAELLVPAVALDPQT